MLKNTFLDAAILLRGKAGVLTKAHTKELILHFPNYVLKLLISSSQSGKRDV